MKKCSTWNWGFGECSEPLTWSLQWYVIVQLVYKQGLDMLLLNQNRSVFSVCTFLRPKAVISGKFTPKQFFIQNSFLSSLLTNGSTIIGCEVGLKC